jgi:hypothetical protein
MTEEAANSRQAIFKAIAERAAHLRASKNYNGMAELVRSTNAANVLDIHFDESKNDFGTLSKLAITVMDIMLIFGDPEAPQDIISAGNSKSGPDLKKAESCNPSNL